MTIRTKENGQTLLEASVSMTLLILSISLVAKLGYLIWIHFNTRFLLRENLVCELASIHSSTHCQLQLAEKLKIVLPKYNNKLVRSPAKRSIKLTSKINDINYSITEKFDGP